MTGFTIRNNTVYLGRKKLGTISWREKVFRTYRRFSKHFFKMYSGWGVNLSLLWFLDKKGIEWIEIWDTELGDIYKARVKDFLDNGESYWNPKYEKDVQKVLPIAAMEYIQTKPDYKKHLIKMYGGR